MEIQRSEETVLQGAAAIEAVRATMRFKGRRVPKRQKPHLTDTDSQEVLGLSVSSGPWAEWGLSVREVSSLEAGHEKAAIGVGAMCGGQQLCRAPEPGDQETLEQRTGREWF